MTIHGIHGFSQPMGNIRSSVSNSEEIQESPAERAREAGSRISQKKTPGISNLASWQGLKIDLKV